MGRMFVRVNGVQLGIEERGEARKSCLTLVMLHGFTGSAAGWGSHLETLAAYGWRVIALDLPGHGQSDAPDEPQLYALEYCQQYILAALQELGAGCRLQHGRHYIGSVCIIGLADWHRACVVLVQESSHPSMPDFQHCTYLYC